MVQWLRICLPMQGTQVQSLVQEAPHAMGQLSPHSTAAAPKLWSLCSTVREATVVRSLCTTAGEGLPSPQPEKAHAMQWRPREAQRKKWRIVCFIVYFLRTYTHPILVLPLLPFSLSLIFFSPSWSGTKGPGAAFVKLKTIKKPTEQELKCVGVTLCH